MVIKRKTTQNTASPKELACLDQLVERVRDAQRQYATFTQEQVDNIFRAAAIAAAQKTEKHPDDLAAYNKKILDSYWELAGGGEE